MKKFLHAPLLLCALLVMASVGAEAGAVYKYRMPDGRILYTSEVSTRGQLLEVLPEPAPGPKWIESERRAKLQREEDGTRAAAKRLGTLDAVDAEIKAATSALAAANAAAEAGVEPLPGERLGVGSGTGTRRTRLGESYWERQRALRGAVDDARRRLDAAYLARDTLR